MKKPGEPQGVRLFVGKKVIFSVLAMGFLILPVRAGTWPPELIPSGNHLSNGPQEIIRDIGSGKSIIKYNIYWVKDWWSTPDSIDIMVSAKNLGAEMANKSVWAGRSRCFSTLLYDNNTVIGRFRTNQLRVGKTYKIYVTDRSSTGDALVSNKVPKKILMFLDEPETHPTEPIHPLTRVTFHCFDFGQRRPGDTFVMGHFVCRVRQWSNREIQIDIPKAPAGTYKCSINRNGKPISKYAHVKITKQVTQKPKSPGRTVRDETFHPQ